MMKKYLFLFSAIVLTTFLMNCGSDKPLQNQHQQPAQISVSILKSALAERIRTIELEVTVSGGLVHQDTTSLVEGKFNFAAFELLAGEATFTVRGLDNRDSVIYLGVYVTTVEPGKSVNVLLELLPAVPMVKLSPYYKSDAVAGSPFVSHLELYNIARFKGGVFRIGYNPGLLRFDTATASNQSWGDLSVNASPGENSVTITIGRLGGNDLVPQGAPSLLDLHFTPLDSGLALLSLAVDSIVNNQGAIPERPNLVIDNQSVNIAASGNGRIEGLVTDAVSGSRLFEANVILVGQENRSTTTGTDGGYFFDGLPYRDYQMTATLAGYIVVSKTVSLSAPVMTVNFVMSSQMELGMYRIVLTWAAVPRDLDAHISTRVNQVAYEVYWSSKGSKDTAPFITLDHDSTHGYGPETITIFELHDTCRYAVHNFSEDTTITISQAHVDVYRDTSNIHSFDIPTSGTGSWWYVFDLDPQGNVIIKNVITDTDPGIRMSGRLTGSPPVEVKKRR